jgi:bifunctional non-homologous end joining protein LigD
VGLEEYRRKRDFTKTPEPAPGEGAGRGKRFCFQRHEATALHYDLRLEVEGVLVSWAVPKGPTLDPAVKRLAIRTEDHPLEYLEFEGIIPAGNYGAGSMMLWDVGTYEVIGDVDPAGQLARGDFKFRLWGRRVRGEFAIVRTKGGKGNEWLLIKKKDKDQREGWDPERLQSSIQTGRTQEEIAMEMPSVAGRDAAMPEWPGVMLASASERPPEGPGWVCELKWDGVRAVAFVRDGKVELWSRNRRLMTAQWAELGDLAGRWDGGDAILDGEICALDESGRPSFEAIQPRIMARRPMAEPPVVMYLFDLLYAEGRDLRELPLTVRKRMLKERLRPDARFRYSEHYAGRTAEMLGFAREQGLEGVVCKRSDSRYAGRRSDAWVKVKTHLRVEAVICGFTGGEGERSETFGALLLGLPERDGWRFIGRVGAGFDQRSLTALRGLLDPMVVDESPFRDAPPEYERSWRWVRPERICTVKAQNWNSTGILRAPVFLGLRDDLSLEDLTEAADEAVPPRLPADKNEVTLEIKGRRIKLTNLNKPYFPQDGLVKRDLLDYYCQIGPVLCPHLKGRPMTLKRFPDGIQGEHFFQKNPDSKFPDWVKTPPLAEDDGQPTFLCDSDAALLYFANLGCIDLNPWQSRIPNLTRPDFMLLDLDPQDCGYDKIAEAAQTVRKLLEALELRGYPKTTGGDGMHIYVPLDPVYGYEQVRLFAEVIARVVAFDRPDLFTTPRSVSRREPGKVYFDYLQIGEGRTISAPYVVRARAGAPVAAPLEWREVTRELRPELFHLRNMPERVGRLGDLFAGVLSGGQRLERAMPKLGEALASRQRGG